MFGLDFLREASFTLLMLSRQKETHGETPLGTVFFFSVFFFPTGYSLSELAPHQVTVGAPPALFSFRYDLLHKVEAFRSVSLGGCRGGRAGEHARLAHCLVRTTLEQKETASLSSQKEFPG